MREQRPELYGQSRHVVGLYVAPPAKAIVLCVDEKPSIQALERARKGYLKLPNGRALTGQSHDYKRMARQHCLRRLRSPPERSSRRIQNVDLAASSFSIFTDSVTAAFPGRKLHVILDNLNTHKKNEPWLKAHPNVQFHFTPTSASWLNQVEGLVLDLAGAVT